MKFAIAVIALCAINVQSLPSQRLLPNGLLSFKPEHLYSYINQLAKQEEIMTRSNDNRAGSTNHCYQESFNATMQLSERTDAGNGKCSKNYAVAQDKASNGLAESRKSLENDSDTIESSLQSCKLMNSSNDAILCYETKGQGNVNPVSLLSTNSRNFQRKYEIDMNAAKTNYDGCSFDVSDKSARVSMKIYKCLNDCISSGNWEKFEIPDIGPADPETPTVTTEEASSSTPESTEAITKSSTVSTSSSNTPTIE